MVGMLQEPALGADWHKAGATIVHFLQRVGRMVLPTRQVPFESGLLDQVFGQAIAHIGLLVAESGAAGRTLLAPLELVEALCAKKGAALGTHTDFSLDHRVAHCTAQLTTSFTLFGQI